jgi:hypothetical protein
MIQASLRLGLWVGLLLGLTQAAAVPQLILRVGDTVPVVGIQSAPAYGAARCDSSGNIYLRFYQIDALRAPVIRISADGQETKIFSLASVPNLQNGYIDDFAVTPGGKVVLAVWGWDSSARAGAGYAVSFDPNGSLDWVKELERGVEPFQIAAFQAGGIVFSGTREAHLYGEAKPPVEVPVTELLGAGGTTTKQFKLPGDVEPLKPDDPDFKSKGDQPSSEVTLGDIASGKDGNIYLVRHTTQPTVYVLSPDGELLRTLHLKPPLPGSRWESMKYGDVGDDRLAFIFTEFSELSGKPQAPKGAVISVYSATTGERMTDYTVPTALGEDLACYTAEGFTFVGSSPDHRLVLKHASAY